MTRTLTSSISNPKYICLAVMILFLVIPTSIVRSVNDWQTDIVSKKTTIVSKPVDPVYINAVPYYSQRNSIPIPLGESWKINYTLEAGKRYHIYLVGDWICNETDPTTDYDILTYYPDGKKRWNTESAGLPEQVAFDDYHHYFVPPETGEYQFEIINDVRDSVGADSAIFMVMENIDLNKVYTRYLEGREYSPVSHQFEEVELTSWAYEFKTNSPKIRVLVDVPDYDNDPIERGELDMYEVRLYAMANPDNDIGYLVDNIGVPSGDLFDNFKGLYGGFNSSANGDRNINAMASCEYPGRDMEFTYDTPNGENGTSEITYILVLIAEHGEGTVKFSVQTDFDPPKISIINPPKIGVAGETTELRVTTTDSNNIKSVWMKYSVDNGTNYDQLDFQLVSNYWVSYLPSFSAGEIVNYSVFSMDGYDNIGSFDSSILIKNAVYFDIDIVDSTLVTGQELEINGITNLPDHPINLTFIIDDFSEIVTITTDDNGNFDYNYYPVYPGNWRFEVSYCGDDITIETESSDILFTKYPVDLKCNIFSNLVIGSQKAKVFGTSSLKDSPIILEFIHQDSTQKVSLVTTDIGDFEYLYIPNQLGDWRVKAIFEGDNKELPSQSKQVSFTYQSFTTHIYTNVNPTQVKLNKPIVISGSVAPEVPGLSVEIMLISPTSVVTKKYVYTDLTGTFSYTYLPDEEGTWDAMTKVGDGLVYERANNYFNFDVIPLTIFDQASIYGLMLITPPYLYATVGLSLVGFVSVLYIKRGAIISHLPESLQEKFKTIEKKKKSKTGSNGATRFRRSK